MCDFIVFDNASSNPVKLAVLEMKGGTIDESEFERAYNQLKNGAELADRIAHGVEVADFMPCLAKSQGLNPFAARMLNNDNYRVRFRTFLKSIRTLHSGESLGFPE